MSIDVGTNLFAPISSTVQASLTNSDGFAILAETIGAPPSTANTFAHGAIAIRKDSGTGNNALFQNIGSAASPSWTAVGGTPAANSITTAMLQDGAVTPQKMSSNNVSGLLGYDSAGAPTQIDGFASGAVLKDNGTGATPSFGFLSALSAETPGLAPTRAIFRTACFTYDFAVDGGTIGTITPASTIQIPSGSIIMSHLAFYRVVTTCTSATDAAEIAIVVPTDGTVIPAIAISNAANPWDIGGHAPTSITSSLVPVTTAARDFQVVISVENVTAGKFTFTVPYLEIGS